MEEKKPTHFQEACGNTLRDNKSVLLIAPTGMGKTIAAVEPFADPRGNMLLGTRIIYTLPMRALAGGVKNDLDERLCIHGLSACDLKHHRCATIHHGQKPDSQLFCEHAIITTIDQYLTSFAGAPLSFASHSGHAAAGALLTSYSVFDEVHLLDPKAGLPLLFAMLKQRQDWGLLSCVMTATLPDNVIEHFKTYLGLEIIRADEIDPDSVEVRDRQRRVVVRYTDEVVPKPDARASIVMEKWREQDKRGSILVFCNQVDTALQLYTVLCEEAGTENVVLAHSRFAPSDRRKRDEEITTRFGKDGRGGILVTTQVAEAGLNISAPVVFSELAAADSLIQRAGRCARFYRDATADNPVRGEFVVWPVYDITDQKLSDEKRQAACLPYDVGVVERTCRHLVDLLNGQELTWTLEKDFINKSLSAFYAAFVGGRNYKPDEKEDEEQDELPLNSQDGDTLPKGKRTKKRQTGSVPLTPVTALGAFERAFSTGNEQEVEKLLRDSITVNVAVVDSFDVSASAYNNPLPNDKGQKLRQYPETVSLRPSKFAALFLSKEDRKQVRLVTIQRRTRRDTGHDKPPLEMEEFRGNWPRAGSTYFVLASEAGYNANTGLTGNGNGNPTPTQTMPLWEKGQKQEDGRRQTFVRHALGAHREAKRIAALYRPFLNAWAARLPFEEGTNPDMIACTLEEALRLAALLHDVGKLNDIWQQSVGRRFANGEPPIARTTESDRETLKAARKAGQQPYLPTPYHAQYVFPFLRNLLREVVGEYRLFDHLALAAARHHVLTLDGDINTDSDVRQHFHWTLGGQDAVCKLVTHAFNGEIPLSAIEHACEKLEQRCLADEAPGPASFNYFLYCLTNRLVIHSDRCDAGAGQMELAKRRRKR